MVPELVKFAWSTQFTPLIFQLVEFQSLALPPPEVVTVTFAVIVAPGVTVTELAPFRVVEFTVLAAKATFGLLSVRKTTQKKVERKVNLTKYLLITINKSYTKTAVI